MSQRAPFGATPNAERHLLQAEGLRRRQLRTALLHGSRQTWRERRRIWPSALAGIGVTAVIVAALGVFGAFQQQQRITEQERQQRNQQRPAATAPASPPPVPSLAPAR